MNSRAYSEVYQIIQYLPESEYKLIPKEQIEFIKSNMDNSTERICTIDTDLKDIELSKEAKAILLSLFHMNIASEKQKVQLEQLLQKEEKKQSENLYKNIFDNRNEDEIQSEKVISSEKIENKKKQNISLVSINENSFMYKVKTLFKKLFNKIKLNKIKSNKIK